MKLELKHLAPYLPYNLQVEYKGEVTTIDALDSSGGVFVGKNRMVSFIDLKNVKPILRPLTSATKEEAVSVFKSIFEHDMDKRGMFDINNLEVISYKSEKGVNKLITYIKRGLMSAYYKTYLYSNGVIRVSECLDLDIYPPISISLSSLSFLFERHFDVFNLINRGLAIEKEINKTNKHEKEKRAK